MIRVPGTVRWRTWRRAAVVVVLVVPALIGVTRANANPPQPQPADVAAAAGLAQTTQSG